MPPMATETAEAPRTISAHTAVSLGLILALAGSLTGGAIAWGRFSAEQAHTQEQVRELRAANKEAGEESKRTAAVLAQLMAELQALRQDAAHTRQAVERIEARWERIPTPPRSRYAREDP